jgi:hypothetical protein
LLAVSLLLFFHSGVTSDEQPTEAIDYPMHRKWGRWLVYAVRVEGVSLIGNYRMTFSDTVRERGLKGLIAWLTAQNQAPIEGQYADHIRRLQASRCGKAP